MLLLQCADSVCMLSSWLQLTATRLVVRFDVLGRPSVMDFSTD